MAVSVNSSAPQLQLGAVQLEVRERCVQVFWMNHALRTLWPYYNKAIGKMVMEMVTLMIEEQIKPVRLLGQTSAWS